MDRPNNGDDNIEENPDDLTPEDHAAIERANRRRAAWKHPSGKQIPPIDLGFPRITNLEEFPIPRSGD